MKRQLPGWMHVSKSSLPSWRLSPHDLPGRRQQRSVHAAGKESRGVLCSHRQRGVQCAHPLCIARVAAGAMCKQNLHHIDAIEHRRHHQGGLAVGRCAFDLGTMFQEQTDHRKVAFVSRPGKGVWPMSLGSSGSPPCSSKARAVSRWP